MNQQRYILTVQNSNIFKEVDLSSDTPVLKIGTLQECDVRLKRELFEFPICVTVRFEDNDWRVSCGENLYINSRAVKDCSETLVHHGDILHVLSMSEKQDLFTLSMSYDFTVSAIDFDMIIDIRNLNTLVIGNTSGAHIKLSSSLVDKEYLTINRGGRTEKDWLTRPMHLTVEPSTEFVCSRPPKFRNMILSA